MICKVSLKNVIGAVFAVLTVILIMGLCSQDVFAQGHVTIKYDPGVETGEITYKLYKVGKFGPNGVFEFIEPFNDGTLVPPKSKKSDYDTEDEWREAWLTSANTVSEYIKAEEISPLKTKENVPVATSKAGFSFDGTLENGFYLVTGTSIKIVDGNDPTNVIFRWPRPMYIMVLNDDPEYVLKSGEGKALIIQVMKNWDPSDEDVKELTRPESITIHRLYGEEGKQVDKGDITLPDENGNWFYKWAAEEDEYDPELWTIYEDQTDEKIKKNYEVIPEESFDEDTGTMTVNITNKYARKTLKITKDLKDYISHDDGSTQDFTFEVWGYAGDTLEFHKFASILFGADSGEIEYTYVKNIAKDVDRIVVKEIGFGNYKPEGNAQKEAKPDIDEDGNPIYSVSFTNTIDTDHTYDTGVINKYSITGESQFKFVDKIGE